MMRRDTGAIRALTILFVILLPLAVLFGSLYILYINSRQTYIVERNYRALATASRQIQARFEGIEDGLRNTSILPRVNGLPAPIPNLTFIPLPSTPPSGQYVFPLQLSPLSTNVHVAVEEGSPQLYFFLSTGSKKYVAKSNLADLLSPLHALDLFDDVIFAHRTSNQILYQRESQTAPITDLRSLLESASQSEQSNKTSEEATEKTDESRKQREATADTQKKTNVSPSEPITVRHHGMTYKLFLQPVLLPLQDGGTDKSQDGAIDRKGEWMIGGLLRERQFTNEARKFSETLLVCVFFLLVLAVLVWPLLKLRYMGPFERLRSVDIRVLAVSFLLAAGILTFVFVDILAYRT
jgi:hypothetical protein